MKDFAEPRTKPTEDPEPQPPPLRSIHTSNSPALLHELGISLIVSTYRAGKLVLVRPDGDCLQWASLARDVFPGPHQ
jgi:hypothetical protein